MDSLVKRFIQNWSGCNWETRGFRGALRDWLPHYVKKAYLEWDLGCPDEEDVTAEAEVRDPKDFFEEDISQCVGAILNDIGRRIPDLYRIDKDLLQIIEIEDTSALTEQKLWDYCRLWLNLDTYGLRVQLFVTERYGVQPVEIPLREYYLTLVQQRVNESTARKRDPNV